MTERSVGVSLPDGVDDDEYRRIRNLMRLSVLRIWRSDRVIAGVDVMSVVDEAWSSMAERSFNSKGPFLPFALQVAKNKAIDALNRAEARRHVRSLDEPIASDASQTIVIGDTVGTTRSAEDDYLDEQDHAELVGRLALVQEAMAELPERDREAFVRVHMDGKSCAAVGRELDPPLTGQRVGQIVAETAMKIGRFIEDHQ